jgi:hypothetical protein
MKFLQNKEWFYNSLHAEPIYEQTLKPVALVIGFKGVMGEKFNIGSELFAVFFYVGRILLSIIDFSTQV